MSTDNIPYPRGTLTAENTHMIGRKVKIVFLDGVRVPHCVAANIDEGWVRALKVDESGKPLLNANGSEYDFETLYGNVGVVWDMGNNEGEVSPGHNDEVKAAQVDVGWEKHRSAHPPIPTFPPHKRPPHLREPKPVTLTYRNWRGEVSERTLLPRRIWFGWTDWHPEPQWLLTAFDLDKGSDRDFALKDFGRSTPPQVEPLKWEEDKDGTLTARGRGFLFRIFPQSNGTFMAPALLPYSFASMEATKEAIWQEHKARILSALSEGA